MPRPLSNDLRERIIGAVEGGMSCNAAAKVYRTAASTVIKLVQQWKSTGSYEAKPMGGYRGHKLSEHKELVLKLVAAKPDATLAELGELLKANKVKASRMGIFRFLKHLNLGYKKKPYTPANKNGLMSEMRERHGKRANPALIQSVWFLSTKREPRPIWRDVLDVVLSANACCAKSPGGIGK